ncbi:MAG: TVP38/TMEM64 family protein [Gemmatimonadales bacterium]
MTGLEEWLVGTGPWAYALAPLIMAAVSILPVPAEIPALLNGALFGPWIGTLVTWSGAMAGAWISFELSRAYGRPLARRLIGPAALDHVDRATVSAGWVSLLAVRLIPWVAFTALNWGLGLGPTSRGRFLWTTALGIIPGAFLFTTAGVGIGYLWQRSGAWGWGLAASVLAGVVVATVRRRRSQSALRRSRDTAERAERP